MTFSRYSDYKNCDSVLVDEIPSSWNKCRVRLLTSIQKGRLPATTYTEPQANSDLPYLSMEYLRGEKETLSSTFVPVDESTIKAQDKDILVLWDGSNAGEFLRAKQGVVSSTLAKVLPNGIDRDYLFFSLKSVEKLLKDQSIGMGIPHVSSEVLKDLSVFVPPIHEQRTIARFLDQETIKIDSLIAEQRKLIELLKEKRKAVISHAVTKGLNPSIKMKDSGVKWFGEVPEHWKILTLRRVIDRIEQGWSPECFSREAEESEWGVLKAGCLNGGIYRENENKALPPELRPESIYEVKPSDLLMSRASGSPELVASTAIVEKTRDRLMISDKIFRINLNENMNANYFVLAMSSRPLRVQVENALSGGNGMANNLPQSSLFTFLMCIPPYEEQKEIVHKTKQEVTELELLTAEITQGISLLLERRSSIITEAVTGKIDVRNVSSEKGTR